MVEYQCDFVLLSLRRSKGQTCCCTIWKTRKEKWDAYVYRMCVYVYMHSYRYNIYILNTLPKDGGNRILGEPLVGMMPEEGPVPYLLHFN